ncbi:Protein of unknown function [Pyronema omphalodes CBS 100304]|uniref:Uncharacterized protein n=1 Tax=Pyronema omphalodes (strain CBS 100304) TaxID=1076935 RepID=U4LK00_PYROM|nr:Protein of unknown function [Pyronema omphalodes CBS 100304]
MPPGNGKRQHHCPINGCKKVGFCDKHQTYCEYNHERFEFLTSQNCMKCELKKIHEDARKRKEKEKAAEKEAKAARRKTLTC